MNTSTPEMRRLLLNSWSETAKNIWLLFTLVDLKMRKESPHYWRHGTIQKEDLEAHGAGSDLKAFSKGLDFVVSEGIMRLSKKESNQQYHTIQLFCIIMQTKRQLLFIILHSNIFKSCLLLNLAFNSCVLDLALLHQFPGYLSFFLEHAVWLNFIFNYVCVSLNRYERVKVDAQGVQKQRLIP